jgi:hypothetical protein
MHLDDFVIAKQIDPVSVFTANCARMIFTPLTISKFWNIQQNEKFPRSTFRLSLLRTIHGDEMFGNPKLYFGDFERLSEHIQEPEHLLSAVASFHRLTPQHAHEVYHEWSKHR